MWLAKHNSLKVESTKLDAITSGAPATPPPHPPPHPPPLLLSHHVLKILIRPELTGLIRSRGEADHSKGRPVAAQWSD